MYENIKRLYEAGRLSADDVKAAAGKGWITPEQACTLIGSESSVG